MGKEFSARSFTLSLAPVASTGGVVVTLADLRGAAYGAAYGAAWLRMEWEADGSGGNVWEQTGAGGAAGKPVDRISGLGP